ncbi:TonB-dependent receptor [Parvularcula marina]|uniref:TonB-dependent receptor n=1 Tax=Parvularcula marina TaxID=2292771 RepID=UPI003515DB43
MSRLKSQYRAVLCGAAATAALVTAFSGAAWAQDDETQIEGDVITVQARKRDEAIEDVPASITAISDEDAERLALQDVADYIRQTPGAILVASGPDYLSDITLRGQGGGRLGFSESTTGIYRNGIYVAGGGFGGRSYDKLDFFDMQAMEVYRGPQGALYGRNAVGGAVNIRTKQPVLGETSLRTKVGYASTERYEAEAIANIPMGESAALRLGGYYQDQQEGHHSIEGTGDYADTEMKYGGRVALGLELSDRSKAVLTIEAAHSDSGGFSSTGQNLVLDYDPYIRVGTDTDDRVMIDTVTAFGEYSHEFDNMDFTFLTNYESRDAAREFADFDHFLGLSSPLLSLIDTQYEDFWRFGLEARLASKNSGPASWMIGVDYLTLESDIFSSRFGTLAGPFANSAALRRQFRDDDPTDELSSYSIFGLYSYDVSDKVNLTVEARVQVDEKDFSFERIDMDALTDESIPLTMFSESWTRFLPTASLSYRVRPDTTLYARVATGYRPGGFNPSPAVGFFDRTAYDPEDVISGEIGVKGDYRLGRTVVRPQLALFYTETEDVQQTTSIDVTNPSFALQNVGSSTLYGGEFELVTITRLGDGLWRNTLGVSGANGQFGDDTSILFQGATIDLSGTRVPRSRNYIVNFNTVYRHPISENIDGLISVGLQAEGGGFDNASHTRRSESFEILDFSLGVDADDWRLTVYGKNVTDEEYLLVNVNNNEYHNTPSLYGVTLTVDW